MPRSRDEPMERLGGENLLHTFDRHRSSGFSCEQWMEGGRAAFIRPSENVALHIQAKAAIPPDGVALVMGIISF